MNDINWFQILLTTIIQSPVIAWLTKSFFSSYFQEKAKNLATKQDIGEITKEVEQVKIEFTKEVELVRADIQFVNTAKINVKSAERDALLEVNLKYSAWLATMMNLSIANLNPNNFMIVNEMYSEVKRAHLEYDLAEAKLHLFHTDEQLLRAKLEAFEKTLELEYMIIHFLNDMFEKLYFLNFYLDSVPKNQMKVDAQWLQEQIEKSQKDLHNKKNQFYQKRAELLNQVHPLRVTLVSLLRTRLYTVMN